MHHPSRTTTRDCTIATMHATPVTGQACEKARQCLEKQGVSVKEFAIKHGLHPSTVYAVLLDRRSAYAVRRTERLYCTVSSGCPSPSEAKAKTTPPGLLETLRQLVSAVVCAYPGGRECATARLGYQLKQFDNRVYETPDAGRSATTRSTSWSRKSTPRTCPNLSLGFTAECSSH